MTNHLALIKNERRHQYAGVSWRSKNRGAMRRWRSSLAGVAQGRVRHERFWALLATVGGEAAGVAERRFGDHTGPRIEDERCAIGRRPVGGKERITRVQCHAL